MTATIYDVAKRAGVGIGTVSRALNESTQIKPDTKARVLRAIHDLKYQPHALAQGLARKKTHMIAIIVPVFTGYFYLELLKGIQKEAAKNNYDLLLYSVDEGDRTEAFLKRTLSESRVDGVLLVSLKMSDKYAEQFQQSRFPIVLVDSLHSDLDSLTVENREGAYLATSHLISLGHKKIGMVDAQLKSAPAQVRLDGYKKALVDHGLPFNDAYLVITHDLTEKDGFNREAGYESMQQLIAMGEDRPTAVFIASDIQAAGAIQAIHESRLRIPEDVSIVGFDDIEMAEYLSLSTMHQPLFEMGQTAIQRLIDRMNDSELPVIRQRFHTKLVIRKSCGSQVPGMNL
ncbi:LacI family DNA-binding transcriptional regulator [candidate division KSB1 bacterium]|nr:LacI family DNA-binding transcriptional regulator [candidate division KSB1 bacterium]